ncbi:MAG: sensor histidine kinase, partial [Candidatus Binatia bacterium]
AQVRISISDSGCGIPKEDLQRIFEPFFTRKPIGEGTGLGLFICHTIVKRHRGEITVKSQLGQGTTFEILLPISQDG